MTKKVTFLLLILISGFAAFAAEPDFAFPKQVSKTAEKNLADALKAGNGPKAIRALINLTLAEGQMEPDSLDAIECRVSKVTSKLKDPAAKAMSLLLRAEISQDVKWADSALWFTDTLRASPVKPWADVIKVDAMFAPTLYDFAVAKRLNFSYSDSLIQCIRDFHAQNPAPLCYWTLRYDSHDADAWALFNRYRQLWISYYPLVWLNGHSNDPADVARLYDAAKSWLEQHPDAPDNAITQVKNLVKLLTNPSLSVSNRGVNRLGTPLPVHLSGKNVNKATICVYENEPLRRLVKKYPVEFTGSGVFSVDTIINVELPSFGKYDIVPIFQGDSVTDRSSRSSVTVTNFVVDLETFGHKTNRLALDPESGSEVSGVTYSYDTKNKYLLHGTKGDDKYSPAVSDRSQRGYSQADSRSEMANVWIDRPIYHPDDTVKFALTAMWAKGYSRGILSGGKVLVDFMNVNGKLVASAEGVTDNFGRFSGEFAIPADGLTGHFSLVVKSGKSTIGRTSVLVSDYKAPEFETTISATRLDSAFVRLDGSAMNYSGFPVQNAEVKIKVSKLYPWVWLRNYVGATQEVLTDTVTVTDESGRFSIILPIPVTANFSAHSSVTSALGETREADCFIPGKPYFISADLPENLLVPTSSDWSPQVRIMNSQGQTEKIPFVCTLISGNDTIVNVENWSKVPSGRYTLKIYTLQPELADTLTMSELNIYRRSDKVPPYESQLWIPETMVESGSELLVGSSFADTNVRYVLCTADSLIEQKWLKPLTGNRLIKVSLPEGINDATLTLWCLRDYKYETRSVNVKRTDVPRNLKLEISSLRDRVNAGERETWTISAKDNMGNPVEAAVLLDVYSKALEALAPFSLRFTLIYTPVTRYYLGNGYIRSDNAYITGQAKWPIVPHPDFAFQTYGRHWPGRMVYEYAVATADGGVMVSHKQMLYASAARSADLNGKVEAEGALMDDAAEETTFAGDSDEAAEEKSETYRPSEVPSALWAPVITTATDGSAQIIFTAPDATTTWAVKALAYDRNLLSGAFGADIIASKPVMVQTSLPRFLRQGDNVQLRASAINNTDSTAVISAFIELYDPISGNIIVRSDFDPEQQNAMSNRLLTMDYEVGSSLNLIGVRIRAIGDAFTDGEQVIIPILPSDVEVLESQPILVDADSTSLTLSVKPGSVVELTANAAWECVTALPGLIEYDGSSVFGATSSLFSAAVADGLMRTYPELGKAIRQWETSDSVLVSRLSKNEDLKIALLENTPWVKNAESQTERMARLSLLLNRKQIDKLITKSVGQLAKLVRRGGLAWVEGNDEASVWATRIVLSTLGDLNQMGYLPRNSRLESLIREAVKYLDSEEAKRFAKNPSSGFMMYLGVRSKFPDIPQNSIVKKITSASVQEILSDWRKFSYADVARAAVILNANGYHATATRLIESLRQNKAWHQTGVSSPVLRAFAAVEPSSPDVDTIRMWLLSRKQTQDWGTDVNASDVIAAIITSGTNWFVPSANTVSVKVNGNPIQIAPSDAYTGAIRLNLPEGGLVEVEKGKFPAWGGVWSRYEAGIDSVAEMGRESLRISRSISGDFVVGSRITVTLTIDADRPMDYVVIDSPHCAAMQPVNQIPYRRYFAYVEPTATHTSIFMNRLPKGRTVFTQEFYVTDSGDFLLAPARVQSQYAPEFTATSTGTSIVTQ